MKLASIVTPGGPRAAVVSFEDGVPLAHVIADTTLDDLVRGGLDAALGVASHALAAVEGIPLADLELDVPIHPGAIRDFVAFALLLVLLIFRPHGILGKPQPVKV